MATTTFTGPVVSNNGFVGDISGTIVTATTLVVGNATLSSGSVVSGVVGTTQKGYLPVTIGGTTKYIPLYTTLTL